MFVVFFDAERPTSHFGWDGAFCGAEATGAAEDRHGWDEVTPCRACVRTLPAGDRHVFASAVAPVALCGSARDFSRELRRGVDETDPSLCSRCLTLRSCSFRIGWLGASVSLMAPTIFDPAPALLAPAP